MTKMAVMMNGDDVHDDNFVDDDDVVDDADADNDVNVDVGENE